MAKYFGNQATLSQATSSAGRTENRPFPGTISEEDRFEIPKGSLSASDKAGDQEWCENENQPLAERPLREVRRAPSFSGPLMLPNRASSNSLSAPIKSSGGFRDSLEDKSKTNLVQIRGRFSVTSENVDLVKDIPLCTVPRRSSQGSLLRKSASVGDWIFDSKQMPVGQLPKEMCNSNVPASLLMPHLQNLFQQTSIQQDLIVNLLNSLQPVEVADASQNGKLPPLACSSENNGIWKLRLFELEEEMKIDPPIKYVLYEGDLVHETGSGEDKDERAKQWRVQAMGISPDKFECRKALPSQWRGLRDEELSKEAGIPGCVFVHMSGFIGGNQSFEGALAMARGALKL